MNGGSGGGGGEKRSGDHTPLEERFIRGLQRLGENKVPCAAQKKGKGAVEAVVHAQPEGVFETRRQFTREHTHGGKGEKKIRMLR